MRNLPSSLPAMMANRNRPFKPVSRSVAATRIALVLKPTPASSRTLARYTDRLNVGRWSLASRTTTSMLTSAQSAEPNSAPLGSRSKTRTVRSYSCRLLSKSMCSVAVTVTVRPDEFVANKPETADGRSSKKSESVESASDAATVPATAPRTRPVPLNASGIRNSTVDTGIVLPTRVKNGLRCVAVSVRVRQSDDAWPVTGTARSSAIAAQAIATKLPTLTPCMAHWRPPRFACVRRASAGHRIPRCVAAALPMLAAAVRVRWSAALL
mmetsp:Transcript_11387/g.34315  ORF Transcript_11387/g.34315 Transcript_11387/m.34315 type:complete len:268 (+) Transcript_11387:499-1302(+)